MRLYVLTCLYALILTCWFHICSCKLGCSHVHMLTCFDNHMLTCLYALMLICLDVLMITCACSHTCVPSCSRALMITCSHIHMLDWSHACILISSNVYISSCVNAHMFRCSHIHTLPYSHDQMSYAHTFYWPLHDWESFTRTFPLLFVYLPHMTHRWTIGLKCIYVFTYVGKFRPQLIELTSFKPKLLIRFIMNKPW